MPISVRLLFFTVLLQCFPACSQVEETTKAIEPAIKKTAAPAVNDSARIIKIRPESKAFIKVEPVSSDSARKPIQAPGQVEFRQKAQAIVSSPISGRISAIKVQIGAQIKAGQPVLTINSFEASKVRAELSAALAELQLAEQTAARQALMLRRGVGLEMEKQMADRQLATAKAEWQRASQAAQLLGKGANDQVIVNSPLSGTVLKVNAVLGEAVEPNQEALLEIGNPHSVWVSANVFENEISRLQKGDAATIGFPALQGDTLPGTVVTIGAESSSEQHRIPVYIGLNQPYPGLRPGMYAQVSLYPHTENQLMLPSTAVLIKDGKRTVVYVETTKDSYQAKEVRIGTSDNGIVPILEGLDIGDLVVTGGALLLDGEAEQLL